MLNTLNNFLQLILSGNNSVSVLLKSYISLFSLLMNKSHCCIKSFHLLSDRGFQLKDLINNWFDAFSIGFLEKYNGFFMLFNFVQIEFVPIANTVRYSLEYFVILLVSSLPKLLGRLLAASMVLSNLWWSSREFLSISDFISLAI